ncbi:MAG TPA: TIR domain-containing protein [Candidatus Eremiobacteraceae bacterium]|nr:TIR domain-containing protein [Candidatus Eremiobacteraceae bacterium]
MAHDVFISYSHVEHDVASAACAALESSGISCWMAPRDVVAGRGYPEQIEAAIAQSRACVLVFSNDSNASRQVHSEIELAFSGGIAIIPFRIGDVQPSGNLRYLLAGTHWLDAAADANGRIPELVEMTKVILERFARPSGERGASEQKNVVREERSNLPSDLTPLVGRDEDRKAVTALLADARLVSLVGTGGIGKTKLALAVGADLLGSFAGGVWFVDLAPLSQASLVAQTVADAMRLRTTRQESLEQTIARSVHLSRTLLILDNCEHLIESVAAFADHLLRRCPHARILATTRQPLGITGEKVYRLPSLAEESAVALFVERAKSANPAFEPHDSDTPIIAEICRRLDGIPLAIELAAARIRALRVEKIAEHLDERFRLLTGGARTALPRQRTLEALVEWSYDLLDGDEQGLFRRLGVFRGSFTLAAASAVWAEADEMRVLDVLTSLTDKSLINTALATETRYSILETLRAFAVQKASEKDESAGAASYHAAHFALIAARAYDEFDSRMPAGWLDRLMPDLDNIRAALEWCLNGEGDRRTGAQLAADAGPIFLRLGLLGEGLAWCGRARAAADLDSGTAGRIEYVASMLLNNLNDSKAALVCAEAALAYFDQSADQRGLVRALSQVAQQRARLHEFESARVPAADAIRRARALGEPRVLIAVLRRCAYALPPSEIVQARENFGEALALARSTKDPEEVSLILQWWAGSEAEAGQRERAIELAGEGLLWANRDAKLFLENQIACWMLALDRFKDAAPHAREALLLAIESQHPLAQAQAIAYCAPAHAERESREAAMLIGYAKSRLDEMEWEPDESDDLALENVVRAVERLLGEPIAPLLERGAAWTEEEALRAVKAPDARRSVSSSA